MKRLFPHSEFYTEIFWLQLLQYGKKCLYLSHFITHALQIFYGELQGLTLYNLVSCNHTFYHSVFIKICPIVSFKETAFIHPVFTIYKIRIQSNFWSCDFKDKQAVHQNDSRHSGAIEATHYWGEGGLVRVIFLQVFKTFYHMRNINKIIFGCLFAAIIWWM